MPLLRSLLHMAWMLITVIPWGLTLVVISLVVGRTPLWWFAVGWFRLVIWGTRVILGVRVQVCGMENLPQGAIAPAILLSKHQFFGWSMARLDMIHINRNSPAQALKQVVAQGKALLAQGVWIIMFPEGTRMARGQQGSYQTAGTRLAVHSGAPVIPIAVASARCWPRQGFVKYPGVVQVSIGKPIASSGREPKELMREVEAWIEAEMRQIDPEAYR